MKKIYGLNEWQLDEELPNEHRFVEVRIHLISLDYKTILNLPPIERKKKVIEFRKEKFKQLIKSNLFENYELIGTNRKPYGVETKIAFASLKVLDKLDFVWNVFITKVDRAKKIKPPKKQNYYSIKMTVAIEIEGRTHGLQTFEERFVLIRAKSHDDAYNKLEKTRNTYSDPYLNSDGQLVRWKIESFDDCYETDIATFEDLNDPEGMEVYSKLKTRRLTKERIWDGKSD